MSFRRISFGLWTCFAALGCNETIRELPPFEIAPVVREELLSAQAAVDSEKVADSITEGEVDANQVSGLVRILATASDGMRDLALAELESLGDGAAPLLAVIAVNANTAAAERQAACELLGRLGTPRAARHLLQICEKAPESWLRAQAAWRLADTGEDWVIPRLILRLESEHDEETLIWLASTLGMLGNGAGLETLWNLRNRGRSESIRATATERLSDLAEGIGAASPEEHWKLWNGPDSNGRLWRHSPSPRLRLAVWQLIEALADETSESSTSDDSLFVLERLGSWVTEPLCRALHDENVSVRVKVVRCLERMGPRANRAGPNLVEALADASLAKGAAAALGTVAYPSAEPVLRQFLVNPETDKGLRLACADALGRINLPASIVALDELTHSDQPIDLRQACATSLVRMGAGDRAIGFLLEALSDESADREAAERTLGEWLADLESEAGVATARAWRELDPEPDQLQTREQIEERRAARRKLLESLRAE